MHIGWTGYIPNNRFFFDIITMDGNWLTFPRETSDYVNRTLQHCNGTRILILTNGRIYHNITVDILEKLVKFALQIDNNFRHDGGNCWRTKSNKDMNYNSIPLTGYSAIDIDLKERAKCAE